MRTLSGTAATGRSRRWCAGRRKGLGLPAALVVLAIVVFLGWLLLGRNTGGGRTPGEMRLILEHDLPTLDPALATSTNSGKLVALLYSTLVIYDDKGSLAPELATTWTISDDARRYTFTLRKDASFPSGRPVTAGDVAYSFERVLAPETASPRTWVFDKLSGAEAFMKGRADHVAGIQVEGPHRLSLGLDEPFAPFLGFLAMPAASIVDRKAVESRGKEFGRNPSGSGPFVLAEWKMGTSISLARNPRAYVKPRLDRIVFEIINEPFTYSTEFKVGNLDMIPLPYSEVSFFSNSPRWKDHIRTQPGLNTYFIGMNCASGPCRDVRVRRAICYAIDADLIVATTRKDQAVRARGPIPPGLPGYDPSFRGFEHSIEKARALLREAGYEKGPTLELVQDQRNENLEVTQLVASSLSKAGMTVKITPMEWNVSTARINEGKFDLYYRSWLADYMDAENFLFPLFHSSQAGAAGNRPRYSNPEVDAMIEKARSTPDRVERIALYRKIQKKVVEDAAYAFLFHKLERVVVQPWVRGFRLKPVFNSYKFTDVYLDEAGLHDR